jgi:deoxyribonucleoside regulator
MVTRMETRDELQLMVQVARMYHQNGLTQEDVARRMNLTRQKVSRLLIAARSHGIVRTVVFDPTPGDSDLGKELKSRFHLHEVVLTPGENLEGTQLRSAIGLAAAEHLKRNLKASQNVGIGWGRTLFETVNLIGECEPRHINVFPLIGGIGDLSPFFQVNELVRRLANSFGGSYRHFYAPAFVEDHSVLLNLLKTQEITQSTEHWSTLDVAVVGIGHVEFQKISSMFFADHITPQTLSLLESKGTVGDICARFFDIHGVQVFPELGVIGINLEQLKSIPEVIAIAGGMEKVRAVLGALRGDFIKTLVIDATTARAVLAESDERR